MKYKFQSLRKNLTFLNKSILFEDGFYETNDKKEAEFLRKSNLVTEIIEEEGKNEQ